MPPMMVRMVVTGYRCRESCQVVINRYREGETRSIAPAAPPDQLELCE